MVQIAAPTKEQIIKDPRAYSLYCQALHGNSGFNQQVGSHYCRLQALVPCFSLWRLFASFQLCDVTA